MKNLLIIIFFLVLIGIGGYFFLYQKGGAETATPQSSSLSPTGEASKPITLDEIVKHNTETDCWFVIEGKVYDVTKYIESNKHPGGKAIIQGCGKDATTLFNTRPMGSGTPHSDKARSFLPNYQIGILSQ